MKVRKPKSGALARPASPPWSSAPPVHGGARQVLSLEVTPWVRCVPRPAVPVSAAATRPHGGQRPFHSEKSGRSAWPTRTTWCAPVTATPTRSEPPAPQRAISAALHTGKVTPDAGSSVTVRRRDAGTRAGADSASPPPAGERADSPRTASRPPGRTVSQGPPTDEGGPVLLTAHRGGDLPCRSSSAVTSTRDGPARADRQPRRGVKPGHTTAGGVPRCNCSAATPVPAPHAAHSRRFP